VQDSGHRSKYIHYYFGDMSYCQTEMCPTWTQVCPTAGGFKKCSIAYNGVQLKKFQSIMLFDHTL
jgi:hypothetical protein